MNAPSLNKPLIICDCDEVILHMVAPFRDWLKEAHNIHFDLTTGDFSNALTHIKNGQPVNHIEFEPIFKGFFDTQMHRQTPINGAIENLIALTEKAQIVILTNLGDERRDSRIQQLERFNIHYPVYTNQGGKGAKAKELVKKYNAPFALFIDDLSAQHKDVAKTAPNIWRLHFVGEPEMAPFIQKSPAAHERIDDWHKVRAWIEKRIDDAHAAPML